MRKRIAGALGATALATGVVAGAAVAQPLEALESYGAGATALAGTVSIFGEAMTFSQSGSAIDSTPQAVAAGQAFVSPFFESDEVESEAPRGPDSADDCAAEIDLEEESGQAELGLVDADIACVRTEAVLEDGAPVAATESDVTVLSVAAAPLANENFDPLFDGLREGLGELLGGIAPITEEVEENLGIALDQLLEELVDLLDEGDDILRVTLGPTATLSAASEEDGVVGMAAAQGGTIELFPDLDGDGNALFTVEAGASSASVVRDPATAEATAEADPALVTVTSTPLLGILSEILDEVSENLEEISAASLPCDEDENPLAPLICIELAFTEELTAEQLAELNLDFGEGTVGVRSAAVRVQVLSALAEQVGGPAAGITLAETAAAANATLAVAAPPPPPEAQPAAPPPPADPEEPRTTLPRTGAAIPLGTAAAFAGLAALGLAVVRRTGTSTT